MLRGPNGSGKTKALEVLFPFVLDGRIEPRRLNPFASEELGTARERWASALARVELGEQAAAGAEARHDLQRLRPYAQPDLLGLLRCPADCWSGTARSTSPTSTER